MPEQGEVIAKTLLSAEQAQAVLMTGILEGRLVTAKERKEAQIVATAATMAEEHLPHMKQRRLGPEDDEPCNGGGAAE